AQAPWTCPSFPHPRPWRRRASSRAAAVPRLLSFFLLLDRHTQRSLPELHLERLPDLRLRRGADHRAARRVAHDRIATVEHRERADRVEPPRELREPRAPCREPLLDRHPDRRRRALEPVAV